LEKVIPPGEIVQVLQDTDCLDSRSCTLSFEVDIGMQKGPTLRAGIGN
jgi:hypothetical protein